MMRLQVLLLILLLGVTLADTETDGLGDDMEDDIVIQDTEDDIVINDMGNGNVTADLTEDLGDDSDKGSEFVDPADFVGSEVTLIQSHAI